MGPTSETVAVPLLREAERALACPAPLIVRHLGNPPVAFGCGEVQASDGVFIGEYGEWRASGERTVRGYFDNQALRTGTWTWMDRQGQSVATRLYQAGEQIPIPLDSETVEVQIAEELDHPARIERFEKPLTRFMESHGLGYLRAGGNNIGPTGKPESVGLHMTTYSAEMAIPALKEELLRLEANHSTVQHASGALAPLDDGPCTCANPEECIASAERRIPSGNDECVTELFTRGCSLGSSRSCARAGFYLSKSSYDPEVVAVAIKFFQDACTAGDSLGCNNLARFYLDGEGIPKDPAKALALYRKACQADDAHSCGTLASMYGFGIGIPKDLDQAAQFAKQGCSLHSATACVALGIGHVVGWSGKPDLREAVRLFRDACYETNGVGCLQLKFAIEKRADLAQSSEEEAMSGKRACLLGIIDAC